MQTVVAMVNQAVGARTKMLTHAQASSGQRSAGVNRLSSRMTTMT